MNLEERNNDILQDLKYFCGAYEVHQFDKSLTLWVAATVSEDIKTLSCILIKRGVLSDVKVLIAQSKEKSNKWVCNSAGYDYCN